MADARLDAQVRTLLGKKAKRLRRQGIIPANIYGGGLEASIPVQIDVQALRDILISTGMTTVVDLHVRSAEGGEDGHTHPVLVERISRHPATGQVLHVDLHQVNLDKPIRAAVPVMLVGEAPAVKSGGVLFHPLDVIEVEALPRDLPQAIEVDISGLTEADQQITVADLPIPRGVRAGADPEAVVVQIVASSLEREVEAEEAQTAAAAAAEAEAAGEAPEAAAEGGPAGEAAPERTEER